MMVKTMHDTFDRYILLRSEKDLPKNIVKEWVDTVKNFCPSGVCTTHQMKDNDGLLNDVRLIIRKKTNSFEYLIPLSRDLTTKEIAKIVSIFSQKQPNIDFDIETNESEITTSKVAKVDSKSFEELGYELAKQKHNDWLKERIDSGWTYGIKNDKKNKTHPLLLPWEQLPDKFKKPDMETPQKIVDFLNSQGYSIIPKDELAKLLKI